MGNCQNCETRVDIGCAVCHANKWEKRIYACYKCDYGLCAACAGKYDAAQCADCKRFCCSIHKWRCGHCISVVCQECATQNHNSKYLCSECGTNYCAGNLNTCRSCGRWICRACYKSCHGCTYWYCSRCLIKCSHRGCFERCCNGHRNACKECGKMYCAGHYKQDGYCVNCYSKCHICFKRDANSNICGNCKEVSCADCSGKCKSCSKSLCYCSKCLTFCSYKECRERSCVQHRKYCKECKRSYCLGHFTTTGFCFNCAPMCHIF